MTHREELQERYEDALFALLMNEVARAEGEQLLREAARRNAQAPSEDLDRACVGAIRRTLRRDQGRRMRRTSLRVMSRVAMAAGIAAMLFTGAFAASETVRANTMNLIMEVSERGTAFYHEGTGYVSNPLPFLVPKWLPDNFTVTDDSADELSSWVHYEQSEEKFIEFTHIQTDGTVLSIDTENAWVETIQINGQSATLAQKEDDIHLVYVTEDGLYFVYVYSSHVPLDDFLHAVEGLT